MLAQDSNIRPTLPAGFVLLPATAKDVPEMLAVETASFSDPWTAKMFTGEMTGNQFARVLVLRRRDDLGGLGRLSGYLCYWLIFDELRIMNLAVQEEDRRQGLARAMVTHAVQEGCRAGVRHGLLEVRAGNAAARALYRGLGFRETGVRQQYYRNPCEDAILMCADLLSENRAD
ncbi:MAG: ribosomal protein S18-alanine N-acetyltransferase [Nitrospiraceae bacterium]